MGSSCYCLNLSFVVKRSFSSVGNWEEGPACLYSYLISSLLPKSILSHLLHCVTSLPFGSVWEWEAWRQKEGKKKRKKTMRIPAKCLPLPLALCAQGKQSQLSATCLCPDGTLLLLGFCAVLGQLPPWMGTSPFVTTAGATPEHTSGGVSCGTGAELVSWGRTGTELTARAGVSGVCDSSGSRTGGRTRWQRWEV